MHVSEIQKKKDNKLAIAKRNQDGWYLDERNHFGRINRVHHHATAPGDQSEWAFGRETSAVPSDHMLADAVGHQLSQSIHHKWMCARVVKHDDGAVLVSE